MKVHHVGQAKLRKIMPRWTPSDSLTKVGRKLGSLHSVLAHSMRLEAHYLFAVYIFASTASQNLHAGQTKIKKRKLHENWARACANNSNAQQEARLNMAKQMPRHSIVVPTFS